MTNGKRNHDAVDGSADVPSKKQDQWTKGIAQLKPQYIVAVGGQPRQSNDDDEEEPSSDRFAGESNSKGTRKKKRRGQNKDRDNRQVREANVLCPKLVQSGDASDCPWGGACRYNHDRALYLQGKAPEIRSEVFVEGCPVWKTLGRCPMGYKCKFLSSHMDSDTLQLRVGDPPNEGGLAPYAINREINHISGAEKTDLVKKRFDFPKSEEVLFIIDAIQQEQRDSMAERERANLSVDTAPQVAQRNKAEQEHRDKQKETYLKYKDTRYFAIEKRKLDYKGKKILSPLTTVGNLPYRRLMKKLGCDVTYSEMALSVPLIQGTNSEWALPKAHVSEQGGFGVQVAASKPWQASKAAEALAQYTGSGINEINLNSGCPIDLLYRQGAGSALLDNPAKMIRCLNAMSYVSGDIPVTVKIRTGTRDSHPIADTLMKRLVFETDVSAVTLHGRSRQQRYTKVADWDYIGKTARALREYEAEYGTSGGRDRTRVQFIGNGDVNNWEDWHRYLQEIPEMDSIMVARGALIKPWIFEEIDAEQYLDKSSSERVEYMRDYAQFAMEHWGTDEYGISQCRRFFCDFMSFFHRYIPMGICERYPVKLNERPPNWQGRDPMETLLGSNDASDWVKLSEMFWGKPEDTFHYTPKHKSNSYN
ncbi:tRNA dihydrouridine synthase DUS3 KNAG_0B06190 [Huiozyma naganishii CBS 8797]|uniref:tRNA-dihydrouridine(47) synthase [NAD(P)(+)] n=1 Tax=Huiozyma naganishii (strain ATCC MYA-139 / BCRC 22969 / CBS 8797 / KCTC 17520 / NBRC 10181 / NCYC 3082 / Yp74L-3) TaxID=1071383 RepID=J7S432_HUIN7|nr:hypothetical protein KNAG_0B06190 [Kazachstania naganishii CBS 8797]CCK69049.1 hypothetical protein KNAG_0B06190 [Kazachstania naganishii CBS 8797]